MEEPYLIDSDTYITQCYIGGNSSFAQDCKNKEFYYIFYL